MGQYYEFMIGNKNGRQRRLFMPFKNTGFKLMEFSWFGNERNVPLALGKMIYKKSHRLVTIGDYTGNEDYKFPSIPSKIERPQKKEAWPKPNDNNAEKRIKRLDEISYDEFCDFDKFLVNHDTKEYLDMKRYIKNAIMEMDDRNFRGFMMCRAIPHPLTLLTAIGNGRGWGDFIKGCKGSEDVGKWAWNLLSYEDVPPKDYKEVHFCFLEQKEE